MSKWNAIVEKSLTYKGQEMIWKPGQFTFNDELAAQYPDVFVLAEDSVTPKVMPEPKVMPTPTPEPVEEEEGEDF